MINCKIEKSIQIYNNIIIYLTLKWINMIDTKRRNKEINIKEERLKVKKYNTIKKINIKFINDIIKIKPFIYSN